MSSERELALSMDAFHSELHTRYKNQLNLAHPEHGFLIEDCFIPEALDECLPLILYNLTHIHNIIQELAKENIKEIPKYLEQLRDFKERIKSILDKVHNTYPHIHELKDEIMPLISDERLCSLMVLIQPNDITILLDEFINRYGILNQNGSLNEGKLLFVELKVLENCLLKELEFHKRNGSKNHDAIKNLLDSNVVRSKYSKLIHAQLIRIIKARHAHCIQDIPAAPSQDYFKQKIKEYSELPQKGLNNVAIFKFLQHYIFMSRFGLNTQPLMVFIQKLAQKKFSDFIKSNLRDDAVKQEDELWNTGKHEWLPCQLIEDIIKRSAGLVPEVTAFVLKEENNTCTITDWLTIHAELRSDVKRLYFSNQQNSIESGHVPSIRSQINGRTTTGTKTAGTQTFHEALVTAFNESLNLREYVRRANQVACDYIISGKKHIEPSQIRNYTVEGVKTNDELAINKLRHNEILPAYHQRKNTMRFFSDLTINADEGDNIPSPHTTDTEYTSEDDAIAFDL